MSPDRPTWLGWCECPYHGGYLSSGCRWRRQGSSSPIAGLCRNTISRSVHGSTRGSGIGRAHVCCACSRRTLCWALISGGSWGFAGSELRVQQQDSVAVGTWRIVGLSIQNAFLCSKRRLEEFPKWRNRTARLCSGFGGPNCSTVARWASISNSGGTQYKFQVAAVRGWKSVRHDNCGCVSTTTLGHQPHLGKTSLFCRLSRIVSHQPRSDLTRKRWAFVSWFPCQKMAR